MVYSLFILTYYIRVLCMNVFTNVLMYLFSCDLTTSPVHYTNFSPLIQNNLNKDMIKLKKLLVHKRQ